jgi:hypothetical protein
VSLFGALVSACTTEIDPGVLRAEPAMLELSTEVGAEQVVPLTILVGESEITTGATFDLRGVQLGMLRPGEFAVSGLAAGRATLHVEYAGDTIEVPIHVRVTSTRLVNGVDAAAVTALDAATAGPYDAQLVPGTGAIIPPNINTIETTFVGELGDDIFEIRAQTEDLDLRVVGPSGHITFSPLEWRVAMSSTPDARELALTSRSMASATPGVSRTATTRVKIGKQPVAAKLLFGGAMADMPALYHYDVVNASPIAFMSPSPDTTYLGGDVALSQDGWRIAVANANDNGNIVDVPTRSYLVSEDDPQTWTTAAYDPGGYLVTSTNGALTLRDGESGIAVTALTTETTADSPAITPDGMMLAYATTVSATEYEMYSATWDATTATLGTPALMFTSERMITEPTYSSDGGWMLFGGNVVKAGGTPTQLVVETDARAGWASAVTGDGAWIAISMTRNTGTTTPRGAQLWLAHLDATTGTLSAPFRLPGQLADLVATRAPHYLPQ